MDGLRRPRGVENTAIQTLAGKVLQLDLALANYGPEANPERAALRERLEKTIDQVWGATESDSKFVANNFAAAISAMRDQGKVLGRLKPSTDDQKRALATATSTEDGIGQEQVKMSFALFDPVSYPLVLTVVG